MINVTPTCTCAITYTNTIYCMINATPTCTCAITYTNTIYCITRKMVPIMGRASS